MENEIVTGACFYAPMDGMDHYFQQQEDCVIHINASCILINRLEKDHIVNMVASMRQTALIVPCEFFEVAGVVLNALGFNYYPGNPLHQIRSN